MSNRSRKRFSLKCPSSNIRFLCYTASSTDRPTQPCPYMGKFDVSNLLIRIEDPNYSKEAQLDSDSSYFDRRTRSRRYTKSTNVYNPQPQRRVKRVDEGTNCDSKTFSSLVIGCNKMDTMEFNTECSTPDLITG